MKMINCYNANTYQNSFRLFHLATIDVHKKLSENAKVTSSLMVRNFKNWSGIYDYIISITMFLRKRFRFL